MTAPRPDGAKHDMLWAAQTHARWLTERNRRQEDSDYRDEWYGQQCGHCRFWVPLSGALGSDFGTCTNPIAEFDGRARFEHDGCEEFDAASTWVQPDA